MPNSFKFTSKSNGETATFVDMDEAICKHMGVEPDDNDYYKSWFDIFGNWIAMSDDWQLQNGKIRDKFLSFGYKEDSDIIKILDFLIDNYTSEAWYSVI